MKILLTGARGQLGRSLLAMATGRGDELSALDLPEFDICDADQVNQWVTTANADVVINAAAYTAVDKAEQDREAAFAVNATGPLLLARRCAEIAVPLVHVSTDYVFDGSHPGAYTENDPVSPLGVYGQSKADGEKAVRENLTEHVIVRTAWLYSIYGNNFVKTMLRLGREKASLGVVADQTGCPTDAHDLAKALLHICDAHIKKSSQTWGTYHFCGAGQASWYEFARAIFEYAAAGEPLALKTLNPLSTAEYPTPARRPANSVLSCEKIKAAYGISPPGWQDSLRKMIQRFQDLHPNAALQDESG